MVTYTNAADLGGIADHQGQENIETQGTLGSQRKAAISFSLRLGIPRVLCVRVFFQFWKGAASLSFFRQFSQPDISEAHRIPVILQP